MTEAPAKHNKISTFYNNRDYKNYEILVHALKSTSRMIGATELSEKAKKLEELAKAGGEEITDELQDETMSMYKKTVKVIAKALNISIGAKDNEAAGQSEGVLEFEPLGGQNFEEESVILEFNPGEGGEA